MSADELSDGEVVREVLGGQHEMYRVLVRRYQDVLYRHAYYFSIFVITPRARDTGRQDET
jgi:hypothetical protein